MSSNGQEYGIKNKAAIAFTMEIEWQTNSCLALYFI